MKLGLENRNKTIAGGVLLALAVFLTMRMMRGSSTQPAAAAAPAADAARPARARPRALHGPNLAAARISPLDPTLRLDLLQSSEQTRYEGSGRNIFKPQQEESPEIPKPAGSATKEPASGPPPPPPPPTINLKFYGFASRPGEPKRVFLSQGEDIFIAGEGDIVNRRYKILHIGPNSIEVEDVLNNNRQTIALTQG